ncbi:MAG: hypothetical protein WCF48_05880, partial [Terriglobales bacterium]
PDHYLLPLSLKKSRHLAKNGDVKWDVTRPMTGWVKSWRKLMDVCGMPGFRFHDLRQHADFLIMPTWHSKPALAALETHWKSA